MSAESFICASCEREICLRWNPRNRADTIVPPVCRWCEKDLGGPAPQAGAFMDRRKAVQISALAAALSCEAHSITWRHRYGRA